MYMQYNCVYYRDTCVFLLTTCFPFMFYFILWHIPSTNYSGRERRLGAFRRGGNKTHSGRLGGERVHHEPHIPPLCLTNAPLYLCRLGVQGRCHVIELHKICLFIYIPYAKDQIWTFNLVYIHADWSFCYLTYNVFSFYGLSYSIHI
jgi:hypothetical protein